MRWDISIWLDVVEELAADIFRIQPWTWKMKVRSSFETKVTLYPRTRLHIHEVFNLLHHRCENFKSRKPAKTFLLPIS